MLQFQKTKIVFLSLNIDLVFANSVDPFTKKLQQI